MDPQVFEQLAAARAGGAAAVFERAASALEAEKDYHRLFQALLMRARHELGLPLVMSTGNADVPAELREPYEQKIVEACRRVGGLFLKAGDFPEALHYLNMIGEPEPVRAALDAWAPGDDQDIEPAIDVAIGQGLHPKKGLALILSRYGTCQGITACEQLLAQGLKHDVRDDCIRLLVRQLHRELLDRLGAEIAAKEGRAPAGSSVPMLIKSRDWLFADENYHIDTSHLNAVVRLARLLPKGEELVLAMQLCEYGQRLSPRYRYPDPPPFEDVYSDTAIFLRTVAGVEVAKGLEHFRAKADAVAVEEAGPHAAEVYVQLLQATGRNEEALAYAGRRLNLPDVRLTLLPGLNEMFQAAGKFEPMAQLARRRNDLLGYVAGIVQQPAASAPAAPSGRTP